MLNDPLNDFARGVRELAAMTASVMSVLSAKEALACGAAFDIGRGMPSNELVKFRVESEIAILTIDNPPVNAVGPDVAQGIMAGLEAAWKDPGVRAIVVIGAGQTFIAGADIRLLQKIAEASAALPDLRSFVRAIEGSPKPVVMAIHGAAFGGGLETAMAGHYRVISPGAQVGQPEVKLGLIPGMEGTQRLPRLAGVEKALEMCAFGEPVSAQDAMKFGIVDRVVEGDLLAGAIAFAREVAGAPVRRTSERNVRWDGGDGAVFDKARGMAAKVRRLQLAPQEAIAAVEAATQLPFDEGCAREQELFVKCLRSGQARALIHVFLGERTVAKIPGLRADVRPREIRSAGVVGAGTMGSGIAMTFANAGIPVLLKDVSEVALSRGIANIGRNYESTAKKGRLSVEEVGKRLALIKPSASYAGFEDVDIVVEAAFERMDVKKAAFTELARATNANCILATNTSTLDVDEIASVTGRPESVLGTHFFSPANVMRLLEVVRGGRTSEEAIVTAMALAKRLGKIAVLAKNGFGFIGNRMIVPYTREAQFLVEEGASVEQVNQALYDFGMPMGPLAMEDLAGLDVTHLIREEAKRLEKAGVRKPIVPELLYQKGRYGQKSGKGWSRYDENRMPHADEEVATLIDEAARGAGLKRRNITDGEIVERCVYALINEGAKVLEEGIALRAVDIDIVYVYGYGFPAWRGGPMFYADAVGLRTVLERIEQFAMEHGRELWEPAALLRRLAHKGGQLIDSVK